MIQNHLANIQTDALLVCREKKVGFKVQFGTRDFISVFSFFSFCKSFKGPIIKPRFSLCSVHPPSASIGFRSTIVADAPQREKAELKRK